MMLAIGHQFNNQSLQLYYYAAGQDGLCIMLQNYILQNSYTLLYCKIFH